MSGKTVHRTGLVLPVLILLCLLARESRGQYGCRQDSCGGLDCRCASRIAPGALAHADLPQFILVTFDDGINSFSESLVQPVIGGLLNPDGNTVPVTYYVTKVNTTPSLAKARYLDGNELANHTATHTTGNETTLEQWRQEISETNQFLVNQVGVPSNQIAGFRAPYLATNEAMWTVLREFGFTYDSSLPEYFRVPRLVSVSPDSFAWPHTLDHGSGLACLTNHCPDVPLPGVWSIPLWMWYDSTGNQYGAMDPAVGYDSTFSAILEYNFQRRFAGNRCPLGIYLHAGQLGLAGRREILRTFLEKKLQQPEVWMITVRGLIEWMRDPVPVRGLAAWFSQGRQRGVGRIVAAPPVAPVLLGPASDTVFAAGRITLSWDVLLSASSYQVQIATGADFAVRLLDTLFLQRSTFDVQDLHGSSSLFWRVRAVNEAGVGAWSEVRMFTTTSSTDVQEGPLAVSGFRLEQSYPNPFNPTTTISFSLPAAMHATVRIFNALGMDVATLVDAELPRGPHAIVWNASSYASGPYFCQLQAGGFRAMERMLLVR